MKTTTCSECGGRVVLGHGRELVCTTCGLVQPEGGEALWSIEEALAYSSPARRVGVAHAGSAIGLEVGLGLINRARPLSPCLKTKLLRLKHLQQIQPRRGRAEGVAGGERALMRVCAYLELPSSVLWRALYVYRRALGSLQTHARLGVTKTALAAACLAAAVFKSNQGAVTSKTVLEAFKAMGHRVNFNNFSKAMIYIKKSLGLSLMPRHAHSYLPYIVEEAISEGGAEVKAKVLRQAKELLDKLPSRGLGGRSQRIIAAAAVYAAAKIVEKEVGMGKLVTQRTLSKIIGVAEFSIRLHYSELFKPLLKGEEG
ncbi:MAG: hypothetical protein N3H31_02705 [Candidatus Nezhaarchaeota archaeon]|nr:hypothetical protein [Candidatus Nezhaarchaeota archaeon]